MTVIICVDNNSGILFNGKRQSKDRMLRKYLLDIVEKDNCRIAMTPYTYGQFQEDKRKELIDVKNTFSFDEDYIFLEQSIPISWEKVNNLILCCWNRDYPTDEYFNLPIGVECILQKTEEIVSDSHTLTIETCQLLHAFDRRELVKD